MTFTNEESRLLDWEAASEPETEEVPEVVADSILPSHRGKSLDDLDGKHPVCFLTGQAGTGKTFQLIQKLLADPKYALVCATTGISAVNLNATTINSALGYSTVEVMGDNYLAGYLEASIRRIRDAGYEWLVVDECSMMHRKAFEYLVMATRAVNEADSSRQPLGVMLTGDFAQLSPIGETIMIGGKPVIERGREKKEKTPWLFLSEEWQQFDDNTIKLEKVWRQTNPDFLRAINAIRRGSGNAGAALLKQAGVQFERRLLTDFDGTTIVAKNDEVDRLNQMRLAQLPRRTMGFTNTRWHARANPPGEWKNIPGVLQLKIDAWVMLLTNNPPDFNYVNGDCGHVREFVLHPETGEPQAILVEVERTKEVVSISKIKRMVEQRGEPDEPERSHPKVSEVQVGRRKVWCLGEIEYWPLRLAYATTCHKSQGLSLDRVQIDPRSHFFGSPNMSYVAISRARTPEGLIVVGGVEELATKIKSDPLVRRFI